MSALWWDEDAGGRAPRLAAAALIAVLLGLAGCASSPKPSSAPGEPRPAREGAATGAGRYYLDDGPGERPIAELEKLPDAVPRPEPLHPRANRPYVVFGREYQPMTQLEPLRERGMASWYGRRYHDRLTSIGERYDMYSMTAAHPRLPLPSYARVTNLSNGKAVIVRVNDRGPFLQGRVIDLSYAAAAKIGIARAGSGEVELELITEFEPRPPDRAVAPQPAPPAGARANPATEAPPVNARSVAPAPALANASPAQSSAPAPAPAPSAPSGPAPAAGSNTAPTKLVAAAAGTQVVQIGAFSSLDNAEAARRGLEPRLRDVSQALSVVREGRYYRLLAGPFADGDEALSAARQIRSMTGLEAFTRPR